ncbi:hypothetical protein [Pseudonocardia humida]|uniref:Uncharacterized protein n=1 Tax=Pseudonocardia humida TaxID=2800819 RepID=A0ABT0ZXU9_9PSEU|nr:hypothetical protein [Pseudonocardia humida]MCO1655568.1 hypothetical protein [Pseudonocardia humida]
MTSTDEAAPGHRGNRSGDRDLVTWSVLAWAAGYGALRLYWAVAGSPWFPPLGTDLLVFTGWWSVGLCAAAAATAVALRRARTWRPALAATGWAVAGAIVLACAVLLPQLVATLFLQFGPRYDAGALASRSGCLAGAALLAVLTVRYQRRYRGDCPACARRGGPATGWTAPPRWAVAAGWAAVAGCLTRLGAQVVVGLDTVSPLPVAVTVGFEVGFLMAGVLLPLALVHGWGRVWPRWVPGLRGRTVPRRLLLWPAFALAVGLVCYFGVGLGQLAVQTLGGGGTDDGGTGGGAFLWVAMAAYWVWGAGLGAAAWSYHLRSRTACARCGR